MRKNIFWSPLNENLNDLKCLYFMLKLLISKWPQNGSIQLWRGIFCLVLTMFNYHSRSISSASLETFYFYCSIDLKQTKFDRRRRKRSFFRKKSNIFLSTCWTFNGNFFHIDDVFFCVAGKPINAQTQNEDDN